MLDLESLFGGTWLTNTLWFMVASTVFGSAGFSRPAEMANSLNMEKDKCLEAREFLDG